MTRAFLLKESLRLLADSKTRLRLGRAARQRALLYDQRLTLNHLLKLLNIKVDFVLFKFFNVFSIFWAEYFTSNLFLARSSPFSCKALSNPGSSYNA